MLSLTPRLAIAMMLAASTGAHAQSGSSTAPRPANRSAPAQPGSGSSTVTQGGSGSVGSAAQLKPAMGGYCPVCLAGGKGWVAGSPQFQAVYDGKLYRFPKAEPLAAFQADPSKYVPALGGDDLVEYARSGKRIAGKLALGANYLGRVYFFASEANKAAFQASPTQYANADLAAGGSCVVCRVDMRRDMPGTAEHVSVHNGLRYQFAGPQQQQVFQSQPQRYAVTPPVGSGTRPANGGSGFRAPATPAGSGSGAR